MSHDCPARPRKLPLAVLALVSALALSACGNSKAQMELDEKLARAEAAVIRAEKAQHAAEAAAARARTDKLALNSRDEIEPPQQSEVDDRASSMDRNPDPPEVEPQDNQAPAPIVN